MTTVLESNFEIIFKHLDVDEVFLWTHKHKDIEQRIVQVHIQNRNADVRRGRCERSLIELEGYHFTFCNSKEVQTRVNQGLGRLHLICRPENRIYLNPNHKTSIALPNIGTEELLKQTADYIQKEKAKILSFMEGYQMYYDKKSYSNAAFMLHQALEIALRTAQKILMGVEKRSHSLKQNIDFFRPFDAILGNLCNHKTEEQAINRLTESYTGSRYNHNFIIDLQKIEFCKDIADRTLSWIKDYEQELLHEIEEKLPSIQERTQIPEFIKTKINMEKKTNINNNHRDLIHNALETFGQVHGLYCFAYVTRQDRMYNLLNVQQSHNEIHHYYLFTIMSNQNRPIMDLQNCVMQLLPEKIKVTLIQEIPEQVEKKLKKGDVFRTNLLQAGECWYKDRDYSIESEQCEKTAKTLFDRMSNWGIRQYNAWQLENSKDLSYGEIESGTKAYLISLSLEQSCIGLIIEHLQFTPSSMNLSYLMDLCDVICPEITAIFFRNNKHHAAFFHILVQAQSKYRHFTSFDPNSTDLEIIEKKVCLFNSGAKVFMENYFQQQRDLQEANKTENIEQCA